MRKTKRDKISRALLAASLIATASACSAEAIDEPDAAELARRTQALMTDMRGKIENPARIIGTRTWRNTVIDFISDGPDDGSPIDSREIGISRHGPLSDGDIVSKLFAASDVPLSPAEIWLALDEDDTEDLPSEIAAHHLRWTLNGASKPRTNAFLRLSAKDVDKQDKYIGDAVWAEAPFPPIPAHSYQFKRHDLRQFAGNDGTRHTCLEARSGSAFPHDLAGSGLTNQACFNEHYQTGWVRHAIANGQNEPGGPIAPTAAMVPCAGWFSDPTWFCQDPIAVVSDHFFARDSTYAASKVISITYSYPIPLPALARVYAASGRVIPN